MKCKRQASNSLVPLCPVDDAVGNGADETGAVDAATLLVAASDTDISSCAGIRVLFPSQDNSIFINNTKIASKVSPRMAGMILAAILIRPGDDRQVIHARADPLLLTPKSDEDCCPWGKTCMLP